MRAITPREQSDSAFIEELYSLIRMKQAVYTFLSHRKIRKITLYIQMGMTTVIPDC